MKKEKYKYKERCKYADKYKAIYPPKCRCKTCADKWANSKRIPELSEIMRFANEHPTIPKNLTVSREKGLAIFKDKDNIPRLAMPWEDYEAVLKWGYCNRTKKS